MREIDLVQVLWIERRSFSSPWHKSVFTHELHHNPAAESWVLEKKGEVLGYACVWLGGEEMKINNLVVHPSRRRAGLGRWLLQATMEMGRRAGCQKAVLEVRTSNLPARELYGNNGFEEVGTIENYYAQEGEDAIVMESAIEG
jgi:ribosomal-protein-alanine N-acetyltransferase